jgi:hypothetical protein
MKFVFIALACLFAASPAHLLACDTSNRLQHPAQGELYRNFGFAKDPLIKTTRLHSGIMGQTRQIWCCELLGASLAFPNRTALKVVMFRPAAFRANRSTVRLVPADRAEGILCRPVGHTQDFR